MSTPPGQPPGGAPSEEELRAAYEAELAKIRVEHVLLEHTVTLINLGMRRTGLAPGTESERDVNQVQLAVEGVRALLPLLERIAPEQIRPIRDALAQLQMAYVRIGGQPPAGGSSEGSGASPEGPSAAGGSGSEGQTSREPVPPPAPPSPPADSEPAGGRPAQAGEQQGPGPAQRSGRLWIPGQ